jgi:phosphatidylglycerophosphate synthase
VYGNLSIGLALFALAGMLDLVDGAVARARNETSAFGGFLDGVVDRFVEAVFLFSFMFVPLPVVFGVDARVWLAALVFLGTCMPSFIRAYADHKGVLEREDALALGGVFERSERLGLIIIGLAIGILYSMQFFVYAIILASVLSLATIIQRLSAIAARKKG